MTSGFPNCRSIGFSQKSHTSIIRESFSTHGVFRCDGNRSRSAAGHPGQDRRPPSQGKWAGGVPVLGYDVDRSGNSPKLVVNAEEAARVRAIFELDLQYGSLLPVVQELGDRGWCNKAWKTKKRELRGGIAFDKGSLYALLTNPIYVGKIKHNTEVYDGVHEPIVSAEVFRQVQARLQKNSRSGGAEARNRHGALLRGLLVRKTCNRAMVHTFVDKGVKRYRYYTCTHAIKSGSKSCPSRSLPAAEIEQVVVDEVRGTGRAAARSAEWLSGLGRRTRLIARNMALGWRTGELARKYKLSPARISQLRAELHDWAEVQGLTLDRAIA